MMLRVCAYCRVSTDKTDQLHSMKNQKEFFEEYIRRQSGWELVRIFADEGVSGTSAGRRKAFQEMIAQCKEGAIDLVLTKEVSRFARNTVDTLEYTRMLRRMGVGVIFINDNIDTRDNDGEFRLSIMASVAQEESRKTSERVKWGQRRSMERGVVFGNDTTFGFETKRGELSVRENEAQIVRRIYDSYLYEGKGTHVIARELTQERIPTPRSLSGVWSASMVLRVLKNEKYVGDLIQKKYVTVDYLTHKKIKNNEIEEKIYLKNHHEAIIGREMWDEVQREIIRRSPKKKQRHSGKHWCSGKIECGGCGARFVVRTQKRKDGSEYRVWGCARRGKHGNGDKVICRMHMVNEKVLEQCVRFVLQMMGIEKERLAEELADEISSSERKRYIAAHGDGMREKKERVMDAYFRGIITEDEMHLMRKKYEAEEQEKRDSLAQNQDMKEELRKRISNALDTADGYGAVVESVTVYEKWIELWLKYVPYGFRIRYHTHGYKQNYTVVIDSCETIERD
jgi:site-specific DNA recombinase